MPRLETALANRLIFNQLGNHGYAWVLRRLAGLDLMAKLHEHHKPTQAKRLLFKVAKRRIHPSLRERSCNETTCECLWCKHGKRMDKATLDRCVHRQLAQWNKRKTSRTSPP